MISIELHLPTISLAAFICLLVPTIPAVLSIILSISHYTGGLQILSGLSGGFLTFHVLSLFFCGLFPKRPIVLILNMAALIGVLSTGCIWGAKRLLTSIVFNHAYAKLEVAFLILWALTLIISTAYLAMAVTETLISMNQTSEVRSTYPSHKSNQLSLNEKPSQDTVFTNSTLFSTPTTGYEMTIPSIANNVTPTMITDELENPPLTAFPTTGTGNFNYTPVQYIHYDSNPGPVNGTSNTPNAIDSSGSTINSENITHPPGSAIRIVKKHKSSNSFLSFFASPEIANSPKPTIKAHHKSDSLLGKLHHQVRNSVTTFRSSNSNNNLVQRQNSTNPPVIVNSSTIYPFENSGHRNSGAFDGWEINSLGIKDRLEWSLNQLDNNGSVVQSRNVSGTSKITTSTFATNFNHKINSAGFTRDARSLMAYKGLQSGKRVPSDPGSWRVRGDDSLTDDYSSPAIGSPSITGGEVLAQYDRERLSNLSC